MARLTHEGTSTVVASGYVVMEDTEKSEGRGALVEAGRFTELAEAYAHAPGRGVQGDHGDIYYFELHMAEGGLWQEKRSKVFGRPGWDFAKGNWSKGWLNPDGSRWNGPEGSMPEGRLA